MPSFQDSAVIFFLALLLFGPKKLPELARQLGKLMGEFRRASNEFRVQMEDELRLSEQAEKQKQIAAMEAAAPPAPIMLDSATNTIAPPTGAETSGLVADANPDLIEDPLDSHPHMAPPDRHTGSASSTIQVPTPLPIATSGDLSLMPPATGLPVARSSSSAKGSSPEAEHPSGNPDAANLAPIFDSIPEITDRTTPPQTNQPGHSPAISDEAVTHG